MIAVYCANPRSRVRSGVKSAPAAAQAEHESELFAMDRIYPRPVILGTDLTGLLVSIALAKAQIEHLLIGAPPDAQTLHHGETTSMVAPWVLLRAFPELGHCLFEKKFGIVHAGKYAARLDFSHPSLWAVQPLAKLVGGIDRIYPLQIDRVALDQALYEKAVLSPYCVDVQVDVRAALKSIDYDRAADRVRRIALEDGSEIAVSHLFDASAQASVVAGRIGLVRTTIDDPYFFVQAYFQADPSRPIAKQAWQDELNVVRLYRATDGIDAIATLIPLGDRLSLRLSTALHQAEPGRDPNEPAISAGALLELAQAALVRKGFAYEDLYPTRVALADGIAAHYVTERAYGANWLLTGTAYANTLVTTAINADTASEALHIGPGFIKNPTQVGALYQHYMDYYRSMHACWRMLAGHDPASTTRADMETVLEQYLHANAAQFTQALRMQYWQNPLAVGLQVAVASMDSRNRPPQVAPFSSIREYHVVS